MRVFAENLQFLGRHGVYDEERRDGRLFRVDVAAEIPDVRPDDDIAQTVDYRDLVNIVLEVGNGESVHLVETLAHEIAHLLYVRHQEVERVEVVVRKRAPDVAGDPEWVGASLAFDRDTWHRLRRP